MGSPNLFLELCKYFKKSRSIHILAIIGCDPITAKIVVKKIEERFFSRAIMILRMIGFCPLASGSKGNAIFLGTLNTRILIDAGIGIRSLEERLGKIGVSLDTIEAILITHEHIDHIRGLVQLARDWKIPVLANSETARGITAVLGARPRFKIFTTGEPFSFCDLEVDSFGVPHDALEPVGFIVRTMGRKIGFCTDLGYPTSLVRRMLERADFLYLEANHEPSMVYASARPDVYKKRVLSRQGHLSNESCAELLSSLWHKDLQHVHLAHLSSECNSPEVALHRVKTALTDRGEVKVSIAYQDQISQAICWE